MHFSLGVCHLIETYPFQTPKASLLFPPTESCEIYFARRTNKAQNFLFSCDVIVCRSPTTSTPREDVDESKITWRRIDGMTGPTRSRLPQQSRGERSGRNGRCVHLASAAGECRALCETPQDAPAAMLTRAKRRCVVPLVMTCAGKRPTPSHSRTDAGDEQIRASQ